MLQRPVAMAALSWIVAAAAPAATPGGAEFRAVHAATKTAGPPPGAPVAATAEGEDFAHAIAIPGLPFTGTGSTCDRADDYDTGCTFLLGAPDVVYAFSPPNDVCVDIELCGSSYDTAVHVYHDDRSKRVACNDDRCGLQSRVAALRLLGGGTYYIVVDGWSTYCGDYVLNVRECPPPCRVVCPAGAVLEGEPVCAAESVDRYNTGCNAEPPLFTDLICDEDAAEICGTYGTFSFHGDDHRDTDWYRIAVPRPTALEYCVLGEAPTQAAILDAGAGCEALSVICGSVLGPACEPLCCRAEVPAGVYWLFVATREFTGTPCGAQYALRITGTVCPPVATGRRSWSAVKSRYR